MTTVTFNAIPKTLGEFTSLPQAAMSTPFDTAAMAILAFCAFPFDKEQSLQMIDFLRGPRAMTGIDKQFISDRFRDKDYVPRSYFVGAAPQNDYAAAAPYRINLSENAYSYSEAGLAKLFATSGGADSPRPITLRQAKDGKWYLWEYSSVLSGIRIPESANPWA